jgi:hypothetical protein
MKSLLLIAALVTGASEAPENSALGQAPAAGFPDNSSSVRAKNLAPVTIAQNSAPYFNAGQTYRSSSSKSSIPPLLIRFLPADERVLDALTEDLNIMAHLIEKSLEAGFSDDSPAVKMGIPMTLTSGSPSARAMYLDGFGALFMVKVNFPLISPDSGEESKVDEAADSEWENAKRELSGGTRQAWENTETYAPTGDFDATQVEALKAGLLQTLKNASNIRNLKPEDFVSVTVFGTPTAAQKVRKAKTNTAKPDSSRARDSKRAAESRQLDAGARMGTVMTIRVKKVDVDSFAKQKLTFDEFQPKATINSYFGSGYASTSLNSWSQSGSLPAGIAR